MYIPFGGNVYTFWRKCIYVLEERYIGFMRTITFNEDEQNCIFEKIHFLCKKCINAPISELAASDRHRSEMGETKLYNKRQYI